MSAQTFDPVLMRHRNSGVPVVLTAQGGNFGWRNHPLGGCFGFESLSGCTSLAEGRDPDRPGDVATYEGDFVVFPEVLNLANEPRPVI